MNILFAVRRTPWRRRILEHAVGIFFICTMVAKISGFRWRQVTYIIIPRRWPSVKLTACQGIESVIELNVNSLMFHYEFMCTRHASCLLTYSALIPDNDCILYGVTSSPFLLNRKLMPRIFSVALSRLHISRMFCSNCNHINKKKWSYFWAV